MVHYDTTVFYKNSLGRATFCRLTELQPVQKCKLSKIADLDKIVAPQRLMAQSSLSRAKLGLQS